MKRLLVVLCVVGLLGAMSFSHFVFAAKPDSVKKVDICHITASVDLVDPDGEPAGTLLVGHVISVSENAQAAHDAHGDPAQYEDLDVDLALESGLTAEDLDGANCQAIVP